MNAFTHLLCHRNIATLIHVHKWQLPYRIDDTDFFGARQELNTILGKNAHTLFKRKDAAPVFEVIAHEGKTACSGTDQIAFIAFTIKKFRNILRECRQLYGVTKKRSEE